ncbi:ribonucleoside-triphosphate reductase [Shewanella putrefaciens]|nr:ribonucleoside-triphosphate reductase [Shewanella putrefaciens]
MPANLEAVLALVKRVKAECENKDIWLWTGYVLGDLSEQQKAVLTYIDVLVDGKFEQSLADPSLPFRGSSNQIIRLL